MAGFHSGIGMRTVRSSHRSSLLCKERGGRSERGAGSSPASAYFANLFSGLADRFTPRIPIDFHLSVWDFDSISDCGFVFFFEFPLRFYFVKFRPNWQTSFWNLLHLERLLYMLRVFFRNYKKGLNFRFISYRTRSV